MMCLHSWREICFYLRNVKGAVELWPSTSTKSWTMELFGGTEHAGHFVKHWLVWQRCCYCSQWSARVPIEWGKSKPTANMALPMARCSGETLDTGWLTVHYLVRNGPSRYKFMWLLLCLQEAVELNTDSISAMWLPVPSGKLDHFWLL